MMKTNSRCGRFIGGSLLSFLLPLLLLMVSGCAQTPLYTINIRYEPTKPPPQAEGIVKKQILTVAEFNDVRDIDDHLKIGYVLKSGGKKIHVLPDKAKASEAVATGVRDYFHQAGYTVSGIQPAWDLQGKSIGRDWGNLVIGGTIHKLEIICDDSEPLSPVKTYSATVNLGVSFADTAAKRILYKTSVEGSASLKDVTFSPEKLQKQLNNVLSDVIEKLFTGQQFLQQMKKASAAP
jgi:hypothetical protein